MVEKVTGKVTSSVASKVLKDRRTNVRNKTAAASILSQREKGRKEK
ncbi:MAG: hypothetical protein LBG15_14335 [Dysgonamonadaceae bacterium]|jgi:hypothetical protein|nr:hypothetical protein [Dysgonamonadaceae bacterium]